MKKSIRIYIKYLRKFLSGFVSVIPFVYPNSNSYPFAKENNALNKDWIAIGEDLNLAIKKQTHERKK
jgi:hypothetical protein